MTRSTLLTLSSPGRTSTQPISYSGVHWLPEIDTQLPSYYFPPLDERISRQRVFSVADLVSWAAELDRTLPALPSTLIDLLKWFGDMGGCMDPLLAVRLFLAYVIELMEDTQSERVEICRE